MFGVLTPAWVPGARPAPFPGFIEPCHPILREHAPFGARWVPEIKFDGYRAQAHGIARIDGDAMEMSLPCQRLHGGARLRMRARCEDGSCRNDDESERNAVAMP
jgi:hypothetical protein